MEPRIQYAKTEDGVSIAHSVTGEGLPFIWMSHPLVSHVQHEWETPFGGYLERLVRRLQLIRFDPRGTGLSDRSVDDLSLDARVRDLDAVVSHRGVPRFALGGGGMCGAVAIAYACRNPDRVSHLVLVDAFGRWADIMVLPRNQALMDVLNHDWEMYTEILAAGMLGWAREEARGIGEYVRSCVTQEAAKRFYAQFADVDVSELLPKVSMPTLVATHGELGYTSVELARRVASGIPHARLVIVKGTWADGIDELTRSVIDFLSEGEDATSPALAKEDVHTILFTDVEASTSLTERLGDTRARDILRTHERIVRDALRSHGGSEVKTMGDGFMASFSSATKALECAVAMQRAFEEHNETTEEPIKVRVGLNAGEPIAEEEDLFGTAVIVAARIAAKAEGGEILAANVVRELAAGKGFLFADRGDTALRGFEDPVRLFEVRWREGG